MEAAWQERRDWRLRSRRWLWEHSQRKRQRVCGRSPIGVSDPALRVSRDGHAALAGLQSCGCVTCPWCSPKIGNERAGDVTAVLRCHRDEQTQTVTMPSGRSLVVAGGAVLVTLTLRHHAGMRLLALITALRHAWGQVSSGRAYTRDLARFGIVGWVAALEITWGRAHGFHPHLHVVLLTDVPVSPAMADELGGRLFARWERALARKGVQTLMDSGGLDVRVCDLSDLSTGAIGDYVAKLGAEVTRSDRKDGRDGSYSMMGLLREVMDTYEAAAFEAWAELESTLEARKTRFVSWSDGAKALRQRAGLAEEQASDESIAAQDLGTEDVLVIERADWPRVRLVAEVLLGVVERDGILAGAAWLTGQRVGWRWATPAPRLPRPERPPQRAPRPSRPPGRTLAWRAQR